jgi:hypothetical protein
MPFNYAPVDLRRTRVRSGERTTAQTRSPSTHDLSANLERGLVKTASHQVLGHRCTEVDHVVASANRRGLIPARP